ncbi:MAG: hypothetical protein ACKVQW_10165 [Pyrinomonadaceae bacterium]
MSIIESTATALVRFTGLGIIVFNEQKKRGEIAIIRDDKHELSIKVQQPRFKDGLDKDIVVYEDIVSYTALPKDGIEIAITTSGDAATKGYEIYQAAGEFNRLESDDVNDFRWIVQMDRLHGEGIAAARSADRYPISKLFIENGLFYVHKLDTNLFFEKVEKDPAGGERARETFGNVAETIGVKLESEEVNFSIKIGEREESHALRQVAGLPFRIDISNMNYAEDSAMSDMPDYYKYISAPSGVAIELNPVKQGGTAGGAVTRTDFCHPIGGGGDIVSIDDLV